MIEQDIEIINKLGLHARAAAKLVDSSAQFSSRIQLGRDNSFIDAKSIMSLMLLAASKDTNLIFEFKGPEEQLACDAISSLFADYFGEGE